MTEFVKTIPTDHSRFRTYANTNRQLPDILGEISTIISTIHDCRHRAQRVILTLRFESDLTVGVSMFDPLALAFHNKFAGYSSSHPEDIYFDSETTVGKRDV